MEICSWGLLQRLWKEQEGQDIAEYAVMVAVILVLVVGTVREISNLGYSFYSFPYILQFRRKRYQRYQYRRCRNPISVLRRSARTDSSATVPILTDSLLVGCQANHTRLKPRP